MQRAHYYMYKIWMLFRPEHQAMAKFAPCIRVDLVLLGAEGVVENGGVINKLGTYQIALAAAAHNTPFYVAAESYKVR